MLDRHDNQGSGSMRRLAKTIWRHIPSPLQRVLLPAVRCYRVYEELRPKLWIAERPPQEDGLIMTVLCVAGIWDRSFVLSHVLGEGYRERCIGRTWLWRVSKVLEEAGEGCCAALVRVRPRFRRLLGRQTWLCIPSWLVGEVDIPLAPRILAADYVKNDLRKIRKNALRYEVTQDLRHLDDFYHNMYLPHVTQTYRDGAILTSYHTMRREFRRCELLLVKKRDEHVAGALIRYGDTGPSLWSVGIRDGNRQWVRDGAASAIYYFLFDYLVGKGFTKVGLGKSRAFLNDGVLVYKRRRGMRVLEASDGHFYLRVPKDTEVSRAFLKANPLIFEREGRLYGAVFTEANAEQFVDKDFRRFRKGYFFEGLSQVFIVQCGRDVPSGIVPEECRSSMSFYTASEVLGFR